MGDEHDGPISKIRARDGKLLKTYPTIADPGAVAVGESAVWVASKSNDVVVAEPATHCHWRVGRPGPAAITVDPLSLGCEQR